MYTAQPRRQLLSPGRTTHLHAHWPIQIDMTVDGILYLHARLLPGNLDRLPTRLGQDLFQVVRGIFDEIIPARFALRSLSFCSRVCL